MKEIEGRVAVITGAASGIGRALADTHFHELIDGPLDVAVLCPGFVQTGILDSHRNRPEALRNPEAPATRAIGGAWTGEASDASLAIPLCPEAVADKVADAIRSRRFWVLWPAPALT